MEVAAAVSLVASVLTLTEAAYKSSKTLYELISEFKNISKTLSDIDIELSAAQHLLKSLGTVLGKTSDETLSEGLKQCLRDLAPSVEACTNVCDAFAAEITRATSHSTEDHLSLRDRAQIVFKEKRIEAFKYRLNSHKLTLSIALGLVTIKSGEHTQEALTDLERNLQSAISGISGQIQGLEIAIHSVSALGERTDAQQKTLLEALQEQSVVFRQCLKMCTSAVEVAPASVAYTVNRMEATGSAKHLVIDVFGDVGPEVSTSQPFSIGYAKASENARQTIIRRVGPDAAKELVKSDFF